MIYNPDPQQLACLYQSFGYLDVFLAGLGVARRMIVRDDYRIRPVAHGLAKHIPRVYWRTTYRPL